jgi:uncharacterized protein
VVHKLINILVRFKVFFASVSVLILLALLFFSKPPGIDSRLAGYNIDHNPYDSIALRMTSLFASGNMVQVLVKPEQCSIKELLSGLEEVENEIKTAFPGIRVESLRSASTLLLRRVKDDSQAKDALAAALNIPLAQNLVGRDTSSLLMVAFADNADNFNTSLFDSVISKKYEGIEKMHALSMSHIQDEIGNSIVRDSMLIIPVILLIVVGFLFLSYRSFTAVLFCLINVSFSMVPTLFFLDLFNVSINQITVTVIPVVIILSLSASVHLITGYIHRSAQDDRNIRIGQTLAHYITPCFLSTLTTAIAFGSFYFSDSLYIRQFGIVTAFSLLVVFAITFLTAPLTLRFVRNHKGKNFPLDFTLALERILHNNRKAISAALVSVALVSLFFISNITYNIDIETYIPRRTEVYTSYREIKNAFHSLTEIDLLIETGNTRYDSTQSPIARRELIALVSSLSDEISKYPEVTSVQSIKNQIDFENHYSLPGFKATIFPRSSNPFVSADQMNYRINMKLSRPRDVWLVSDRFAQHFSSYEPNFKYALYSDFLFFHYLSSSITNSLLRSILFSSILIIIIIFLLTLSFKKTLISIIANAVPLGFLILIFVVFGIDMNITTSISLIICLGLIVDDTIHILYRRVRLKEPLEELGFGILTTTIIITLGFISFLLSQSLPNQVFALLCAAVFIISVVSDMTVMTWVMPKDQK